MNLAQTAKERFRGRRVVVIGDAVADQFLEGTISRVSREAPVFILRHDQTATVPGAAANTAANVAALGGHAFLIGYCGADPNGIALRESLQHHNVNTSGLVAIDGRMTTTKVRVVAGHLYAARQQVIRIDYEERDDHSEQDREGLIKSLHEAAQAADALIVSDYGYGAVFPAIFDAARGISQDRNIPLVVDSRYRLTDFAGATTATPNREEVEQIFGKEVTSAACESLLEQLGLKALLVTNGNRGMTLFEKGKSPLAMGVIGASEPVDVTGAGDTVTAAYTLALSAGLSFADAAAIANHAGGLVVMKKGTATVTAAELWASLAAIGDEASVAGSK